MHPSATFPMRARALLFAAAMLMVGALPAWATKVTFRYQPMIGGVNRIAVAGSFNAWNATDHPLADADKDGIWEATYDLPAGKIEYKFVVNGDQWMADEHAAQTAADGFGGQNAIAIIADKPLIVGLGASGASPKPSPEGAAKMGLRRVPFKFHPTAKAEAVSLAGSMNDWTVGKNPLAGPDANGDWTTTMLLAPGSYQYKFVVGATGWTQDKAGQDAESSDGFGGMNSIRNVDERYPAIAVKKGDGDIFAEGIEHTQSSGEVNNMGARTQFTARAHIDDVQAVDLVTWPAGKETITAMRPADSDKVFDYFRADIATPADGTPYAFRYHDGAKSQWLGAKGLAATAADKFTFEAAKFPAFVTPDWVKNGIIYQIFPDRFRNGDQKNDQDFHEWYYKGKTALPPGGVINPDFQEYYHLVKDWTDYSALTQAPHTPDHRDWMAFYGGDLAGVRQSLDYLKSLGVTILYFNPLFEAKSAHKYDAADFRKIDPHFGTNEEFIALVKEAHAKGIRIILDIVYNHSGNANWAFQDAVDNGPKSPYYNWYEFKQWPLPQGWPSVDHAWKPSDYYTCWWNFGDLPDLNFDLSRDDKAEIPIKDVKDAQVNIPLVKYLLDATEYWIKTADADGVRLDAPNEVPFWFWKLFNQRVKSAKPDAYIVGELWGNAAEHVRPGVFDAVMNYAFFRDPVARFLGTGQGSAAEFDATLASGRLAYPAQAVAAQMNLIDSHDTVRFLTQVGGNVNRLKLAALFQMSYIGAPSIYYGDEIAMEGGRDPDCRRPFVWSWKDEPRRADMHEWYTKLCALRLAHPALRTGEFRTIAAEGKTYAFTRKLGAEEFLVVLNAGGQPADLTIDLGRWGGKLKATDALAGGAADWAGTAHVTLLAETGRIYQITR